MKIVYYIPNLQTKIIAFLLILFTGKEGHGQLSLENIFLTNKYALKQADDLPFLHHKPLFARLSDSKGVQQIAFYNYSNEKVLEFKLSGFPVENSKFSGLTISNTDAFFLVREKCENLYRRSYLCNYYFGNKKGIVTPLSDSKQMHPLFSPDDKKIAFIKNNNLFYKEIMSGMEVQITFDGEWNKIINGKSDWVYEEELKLARAYEWNKQSNKIAYLKFDETDVREYSIPMYYDMQYPNYFTYKYPKTGEENSKVSLWLYDVKSKKNKQLLLPNTFEYIPRIYWNAGGDEVIVILLNRHQDTLQLVGYNVNSKKTRIIYQETDKAYVSVPEIVEFLSDNSFMLSSEKDGYNHLYHYNKDGKLLKQLTNGNFEVNRLFGIDEKNKTVYFQSNEGNELETVICSIDYETLQKKIVSQEKGSNTAVFSNDFTCYLHTFSNANTPPKITLEHTDSITTKIVEFNQMLMDSLKTMPNKKFIKITTKYGSLNAWYIQSPKTDTTLKHPLFVYVYGGPGDQKVLNQWQGTSELFLNFLAENGYIVLCIDNRGTGGRGSDFKKSTFLQLGKSETEDQIAAVLQFASSVHYIDTGRVGIYGWSYGGFLAANCLFSENTVFKSAIAVAPITNWNLYNTVYTERYMRTPKENPSGFNNYNPVLLAKRLQGNLLLIHGTSDDNVHFQHSIQLINALNAMNKTYQLYIYPDAEHGTTGNKMRYDLYYKIFQYLKEKL